MDRPDDPYDGERRRLSGMLPGADLARAGAGFVALVDDVDRPIPVLVERGRYEYVHDSGDRRRRVLTRPPFRLVLTDDHADYAGLVRASADG